MGYMFLPLRRYAEFGGRSRRMEFWMWTLFVFLLWVTYFILIFAVGGGALLMAASDAAGALAATGFLLGLGLLYFAIGLAIFLPGLAVTVRRLHDTGRSGWWVLLVWGPFIAAMVLGSQSETISGIVGLAWLVGAIVLIVFCCLDGTPGANRYGDDPKGRGLADTFA
ncbi:DUF805 domain-containing protein [Parasphingopyxis sp.]|uniref:DUF805 domain-containing protein n=1 Tax=Parasphingopyxis sp. TaxID=1920299 RepID=UPI0026374EF0|nr:DUF805 domain-containing protein [Parasphingopyxis sp.]